MFNDWTREKSFVQKGAIDPDIGAEYRLKPSPSFETSKSITGQDLVERALKPYRGWLVLKHCHQIKVSLSATNRMR